MNLKKEIEILKINFVKDLMKLPVDKKTNTIKIDNVKVIIEKICKELEKGNPNIMETLNIMCDEKLMKRLKQKSTGKNIPLKDLKIK